MTETIHDPNEAGAHRHPESGEAEDLPYSESDIVVRAVAWENTQDQIMIKIDVLQAAIKNGGGYTRDKEGRTRQMAVLQLATEYMEQRKDFDQSPRTWADSWRGIFDYQLKLGFINPSEYARHLEAVTLIAGFLLEEERRVIEAEKEGKNDTEQTQPDSPVESTNPKEQHPEAAALAVEAESLALIGEVLRAAKWSARILTSVTPGANLLFNNGNADVKYGGGVEFGDGVSWGELRLGERGAFLDANDSPEALIFEPAMTTQYETVVKTVEAGGLFRKKTKQVEERVQAGEIPVMVENPETGQQEPGVTVRYQFNGNGYNYDYEAKQSKGYPPYTSPDSSRSGNYLFMEVTLPKTVASKLRQAAFRDPNTIRQFAGSLLAENGATEASVKTPPYAELPSDWTMTIADMRTKDGKTHQITSRQTVKF